VVEPHSPSTLSPFASSLVTCRVTSFASHARAKINLNLHILGRRGDGYHELNSLVAFAGCHDTLLLEPHAALALHVKGREGSLDDLSNGDDNLILKATHNLLNHKPDLKTGRFTLTKRLPIGAGIGGGSADAAAALRLLAKFNDLPLDHPTLLKAAQHTGADVPVCLASQSCVMSGIGERLSAPLKLPPLFAVLLTPPIHVATRAVFERFALHSLGDAFSHVSQPLLPSHLESYAALITHVNQTHNDLQQPAIEIAPQISIALESVRQTGCDVSRMSGSGATCFGLFPTYKAAAQAAKRLNNQHPKWWCASVRLS
jgi:4-diphosphocytidyl-2-C-methyl-D-erythritol kinase